MTEPAVRCLGRHFLFCTHAHMKSHSQTKDHGHWSGSEISTQPAHGWHSLFPPQHWAILIKFYFTPDARENNNESIARPEVRSNGDAI